MLKGFMKYFDEIFLKTLDVHMIELSLAFGLHFALEKTKILNLFNIRSDLFFFDQVTACEHKESLRFDKKSCCGLFSWIGWGLSLIHI